MNGFRRPFLLLLIVFIFSSWFLTTYPNVGPDISYRFEPIGSAHLPWVWNNVQIGDGMGSYVAGTLWSYPSELVFETLTKIGIPYWLQIKYFMLLPILLGAIYGIYKLSEIYKADWLSAVAVYILNTYFILLLDGGQMNIAFAYSLIPVSFYSLEKTLLRKTPQNYLTFAISAFFVGVLDFRIVYVLAILVAVRLILATESKSFLIVGFTTGLVLFLLNLYWLMPAIFVKAVALPTGFDLPSQVKSLSFSTITHSLYLQQPHWYLNTFGRVVFPNWYFAIIPGAAFAAILVSRGKKVAFLSIIAVIGVFLSKGANPPFGEAYLWLFQNMPGFSLFRDPTKFFILISFSYALLIGIAIGWLSRKTKKFWPGIVFALYLVLLIFPVYLGKMTGSFVKTPNQEKYFDIAESFEKENEFFRTFWIPTKPPLGYVSWQNPSTEAFLMAQKRPFAIGVVGNYENFNYIREAPFMGQLFGVAGIKYIAYPYPDDRKVELKEDNISYYHNFAQQIDNLDWTADKVSSYPINIWKTNQAEDHFFITNNTYYILGSDRIYTELVNLPGFKLSNNALVFLEEGNEVNKLPSNKIILFDKKAVDLSAAVLPREKYISLAEGLPSSPDSSGWWKREAGDLIWWRDFLQQKYGIDNLDFDYGKGWGVAEGEKQLTVSNSQFSDGKLLLVRAMKSSKGGMIVFSQGGMEVGRVNTFDEKPQVVTQKLAGYGQIPEQMFEYDEADFSWYEVGRLVSGEPLVIATSGEINVVNTLVSVEKTEWSMAKEEANKLDIIYWQNITNEEKIALFAQAEDKPEIKYERLSPTNYKISVSGLTKPVTIVFSESFDSLWELNGGGAYPVYSFLNGFAVQEDGDYEVIFSAQKYANFGFVLSLASALVFLVAMLYLRIKYTKAKHV